MSGFSFTTFVTKGLAAILLIYFFVIPFLFGGGFKLAFNLGKFFGAIPVWVFAVVAGLYLLSQLRN